MWLIDDMGLPVRRYLAFAGNPRRSHYWIDDRRQAARFATEEEAQARAAQLDRPTRVSDEAAA